MSWFHKHKWILVSKTYAPPPSIPSWRSVTIDNWRYKLFMGCTTYLWKCSDEKCDAIRKEECLGKEIEITKQQNGD
jgi:hypothetical protein